MNALLLPSFCTLPSTTNASTRNPRRRHQPIVQANSTDIDAQLHLQPTDDRDLASSHQGIQEPSAAPTILPPSKDLKKVVQKTAATFAPRASTATKNPAVPGLCKMLLGGALSFNLILPSNEPDIWRLMGMWSIWMFTIPSLRARDCSKSEKEALNYLFLLVRLLNVAIPFFVKSFAVVWSADTAAFFAMYAWKMNWLKRTE
uniref:Uncharacterized protein n=1 Tax=Kalanchoe fedtschenkoi TaxID=63787 RepID=A0A7N0TUH2_KALFE